MLKFKRTDFSFSGALDDSKSIVNRLLIVRSFFPDIKFQYQSEADDVRYLEAAVKDLESGKTEFDIGAGGTTLRFFLGRLSRVPGHFRIKANPSLLARPQTDLFNALKQLGTEVSQIDSVTLEVKSQGWKQSESVSIKSDLSSQFASAILLNCWNLNKEFRIKLEGDLVSESFFELTKKMCRHLGMQFKESGNEILVEAMQVIVEKKFRSEVDASSLFTLACFAHQFGSLTVKPCINYFGQPDFWFLELFKSWKVPFDFSGNEFSIKKNTISSSIEVDIKNCPDLFPMLSALLSFCDGPHRIYGAPHLVSKESNRIEKTVELLNLAAVECEQKADGIAINGRSKRKTSTFSFDPAHDHRMAFAAAFFAYYGYSVDLKDKFVVNKSFPQFWSILGLSDITVANDGS